MVEKEIKKGKKEVVVIINPKKEFTSRDISQIKNYLAAGGKILLLDSPFNTTSTSNSFLSTFGVKINETKKIKSSSLYAPLFNKDYLVDVFSSPIEGGKSIFLSSTNDVIGTAIKEGKGVLVVLSFADRFTDAKMGGVESVIPDEELMQVYQLEFDIFEGLVEGTILGSDSTLGERRN